jgi:hypothetical protein
LLRCRRSSHPNLAVWVVFLCVYFRICPIPFIQNLVTPIQFKLVIPQNWQNLSGCYNCSLDRNSYCFPHFKLTDHHFSFSNLIY